VRTPVMTPVGALARGLAAAAVGTLAMDLLLFARYKRGDGKSGFRTWELSSEIESWEQAPAPAQVGKRLFEGLFQRALPDQRAPLVLESAYERLQQQAARITDARLRHSFLENVPHHRALVAAWTAAQGATARDNQDKILNE